MDETTSCAALVDTPTALLLGSVDRRDEFVGEDEGDTEYTSRTTIPYSRR